jgi:hypothetical protein
VGFATLFESISPYVKSPRAEPPAVDRAAIEREVIDSLYAPKKTFAKSSTKEEIERMRRAEMDTRLRLYGYDALRGLSPGDEERYSTRLSQIVAEERNRPRPNIFIRILYRMCDFL